jgi:hypothetical protein
VFSNAFSRTGMRAPSMGLNFAFAEQEETLSANGSIVALGPRFVGSAIEQRL